MGVARAQFWQAKRKRLPPSLPSIPCACEGGSLAFPPGGNGNEAAKAEASSSGSEGRSRRPPRGAFPGERRSASAPEAASGQRAPGSTEGNRTRAPRESRFRDEAGAPHLGTFAPLGDVFMSDYIPIFAMVANIYSWGIGGGGGRFVL